MSSSFGPVNSTKRKHGECVACWDENHVREHGSYFESRVPMVGKICKHRLKPAKRLAMQSRTNRLYDEWRNTPGGPYSHDGGDYWARQALLPDYCGGFAELVLGSPGNLIRLDGMQPGGSD